MKKTIIKILSIVLILTFCITPIATASVLASDFIYSRSVSAAASGNGKVDFKFSITATGKMTEIGATKIEVKNSSGVTVKTFRNTDRDYSFMMGANKTMHSGTVTYQGVPGNQYYAIAYFKAANSTGSDTDSVPSGIVTA